MKNSLFHISAALLISLAGTLNAGAAQTAAAVVAPAPAAEQSPLERFRTFTGKRNADNLIRLLTTPVSADAVLQKPEVAISDGKTNVELTVTLKDAGASAPNFAAVEGRLISSKQIRADVWQLVVLPDAGSWKTAVIIQKGDSVRPVSLVVAPPLSGDLSVKGFAAYLDYSADPGKRVDLNGDGSADYQDDYIHTANVLAVRNADPHDPATRNKRAREQTPVRPKP